MARVTHRTHIVQYVWDSCRLKDSLNLKKRVDKNRAKIKNFFPIRFLTSPGFVTSKIKA
jgi:hypothetical protein